MILDPDRKMPSAVVFDLDGTLVDTAPDLCRALNHVLDREGRDHVAPDALRHMVGHGARVLITKGMTATGAPATDDDLERLLPVFLDYYGEHIADESKAFDGAESLLKSLRARGVPLGVCTNKPEALARDLLDHLGLSRHFGAVVGGNSLPVRKPDPRPLMETIDRLNAPASAALMVGDSRTDVDTARAAGVPVICVSFGFTDVPVASLSPDAIIDHFNEFDRALGEISLT